MVLSGRKSESSGDNREMAASRVRFLEAGYYRPLADALVRMLAPYAGGCLAETGCGWGYYLDAVACAYPWESAFGTDLSKFAVRVGAKRSKKIEYAVANSFRLPYADGAVDVLMNIFAPVAAQEFARVVADDGILAVVTPGQWHLREIKTALYGDTVYPNPPAEDLSTPWEKVAEQSIEFCVQAPQEIMQDWIAMTPYCYTTRPEDICRMIDEWQEKPVTCAFCLRLFRRGKR